MSPVCAIVLVAGSVCWAAGSIFSRHLTLPRSLMLSTAIFLISGGILVMAVSFALGELKNFDVRQISLPFRSSRSVSGGLRLDLRTFGVRILVTTRAARAGGDIRVH